MLSIPRLNLSIGFCRMGKLDVRKCPILDDFDTSKRNQNCPKPLGCMMVYQSAASASNGQVSGVEL